MQRRLKPQRRFPHHRVSLSDHQGFSHSLNGDPVYLRSTAATSQAEGGGTTHITANPNGPWTYAINSRKVKLNLFDEAGISYDTPDCTFCAMFYI
jgi:hypothetical protein